MGSVLAVLGPTNTGKTWVAMERLLEHATGMVGFPLRLLARENYDRVVRARGADSVALVTGEERIVPPHARYFICTVEAMPLERRVDFLAIDEVQLAADRERGHVFCDRILRARGTEETLLLGADTIRPLLRRLVPRAEIVSRPRLSTLSYVEPRKLTRLPRRSAVIVFSLQELYATAERLRRESGGTALVFGALSPRTRNAQVGLYQAGEVDYLVATDAIGMGLNLDIDHVAFTALVKFDGRGPRALRPAEVAQIAGRAGRHVRDGSFGATAELGPLDPALVEAVEAHHFEPLRSVYWRNPTLDFASGETLVASLERRPPAPWLVRMRHADDHRALETLLRDPEVGPLAHGKEAVRLLWEVCQVPDFRNVLTDAHTRLLGRVFLHLRTRGSLPEEWVRAQVAALDRDEGDLDALLGRIAAIRTWTYVAHRPDWLQDASYWQQRAREVEDRLSDALHERLTQAFVDRRAAVLARQAPGERVAAVAGDGRVAIGGVPVGRLLGFRFEPGTDGASEEATRSVRAAANRALRDGVEARVAALVAEPDTAFALEPDGSLAWRGAAVARLAAGESVLAPRVEVLASELLDAPRRERVRRRLADWLAQHLRRELGPLVRAQAAPLRAPARAIVFGLAEGLGSAPRGPLRGSLGLLSGADRRALAELGVVLGWRSVFLRELLTPPALRLRASLWAARHGPPAVAFEPGAPMLRRLDAVDRRRYGACGYELVGPRAVRVDCLDRLAALAHRLARHGTQTPGPELAAVGGGTAEDVEALLRALRPSRPAAPEPAGEARGRRRAKSRRSKR